MGLKLTVSGADIFSVIADTYAYLIVFQLAVVLLLACMLLHHNCTRIAPYLHITTN